MRLKVLLLGILGVVLAVPVGADSPPTPTSGAKEVSADNKPAAKPPAKADATPVSVPHWSRLGSQIPPDKNNCILCHGESDLWDEKDPKARRRFISKEKLAGDVHWKAGVNCHDCHGGNYESQEVTPAHSKDAGFRSTYAEIRKYCEACHKEQVVELRKGVHDKAGPKDDRGAGTLLDCSKCHGPLAHGLPSHNDRASPLFPLNQIATCGGCHSEEQKTYTHSVHGQGVFKMGLEVTAVCANCHGAHGIYRAADTRSTLNPATVAITCGKCHRGIEDRLDKSVHGRGKGPGTEASRLAPGGRDRQRPSCTSCHQGHDFSDPGQTTFRLQLASRCGNCHAQLSRYYAMSIHGQLSALGYGPAADCADCHGTQHNILPVSDPNSLVSPQHRLETCRRCHPHAVANFIGFDPHADYTDGRRSPVLHGVYIVLMTLLISTFVFFGLHSMCWFVRGMVDVFRHGRPHGIRPGQEGYVRFTAGHRLGHMLLAASFLGLALTGLPLKYSQHAWAKTLAAALGGFENTSFWHRVCALVTFGCFAAYMILLFRRVKDARSQRMSFGRILFGPDSPVPNLRDVVDFFKMLYWFIGLGPKPTFERWAYWEKFDFWGAITDVLIIGSTGLVLWFPNLFCRFLPGSVLNIAKVIHSTQALLATGFVFAIHFFNTHLRADKFPADMSVLTGLVSEEEMRDERPEYLDRLRQEGRLAACTAQAPSRLTYWSIKLAGFVALAIGLALLAGIILAALEG